jgi:hypothetical protein
MDSHVFARSGIASFDDLQGSAARELFRLTGLEQEASLSHEASSRYARERGMHPSMRLISRRWPFPLPDPTGPTGLRSPARNVLADALGTDLQPVVTCPLAAEGTLWREPANTTGVEP